MPTYHQFKGSTGTGRALTDLRSGAKLPLRKLGGWIYERDVTVTPGGGPLIGGDSDEIIKRVTEAGYFLWPDKSD